MNSPGSTKTDVLADAAIHLTLPDLEAGLAHVKASPKETGSLELIVSRPAVNRREVHAEGQLSTESGLEGDSWAARGDGRPGDGSEYGDAQVTLMNSRLADLVSGSRNRWPLAGDQLYVDLDLSEDNLPPGSRIQVGEAVLEVTAVPHTGCKKFAHRFGLAAMKFINNPTGRRLNLRGINTRVAEPGTVRVGDTIRKVD